MTPAALRRLAQISGTLRGPAAKRLTPHQRDELKRERKLIFKADLAAKNKNKENQ